MPIYYRLGQFPQTRHTVFEKPEGGYYYEQLFGTEGFSGLSSLLYHAHRPTMVREVGLPKDDRPVLADDHNIKSRLYDGLSFVPADDYLDSRSVILFNSDCEVGVAAPRKSQEDYFYKNSDADEILFVHEGTGTLKTMLGQIDYVPGDYLVIPKGIIYQLRFDGENNRLLFVNSFSPVYTPKRYRNGFGQMLEHSPFCERDYKMPQRLETFDEKGEFTVVIRKQGFLHPVVYASHPFDVIGWDGYNFPYGFSIKDFQPITGKVHMPPPIHQTFESRGFVVCSFCPRLYDYHEKAVPAPYNHSNIDSDEVIYYVEGDFMSRNDIDRGYITLHPAGIPHGPHPGAMERSLGKKGTEEYAVMVDTFKPLNIAKPALEIEKPGYFRSWLE
ncbi:homogentisate 1,2-dioxygenase [Fulvitalea axinellae]|uniref:Homogentisate 1,2-dioxygenase n=1 Tax=Fulvitalea axinellae TaxID=1182444 RepID=A0AAU9CKX3_9BACT|nr:homogentisate 1,2-dioxygenase [Fulvitalea axinellae]